MGTLKAPPEGVTVRMYRQGLGDCFLLAFPTDQPGAAFYLLIDCGVILGTEAPEPIMRAVAEDIREATGGDIHLLVATHEHWDHLSGFIQAGETFRQMRVHNLWFLDVAKHAKRGQCLARFSRSLNATKTNIDSLELHQSPERHVSHSRIRIGQKQCDLLSSQLTA